MLVVIESPKHCQNNCPELGSASSSCLDLGSASSFCMEYFANYSYIPVSEINVDYKNVNIEQHLKLIC